MVARKPGLAVANLVPLVLLIVGCSGDGGRSSASPTIAPPTIATSPAVHSPTLSPSPTSSATPATPPAVPTRFFIENGGVVPFDNGLLFVRLDTGDLTFWALPGPYGARPISRDGRWIAWSANGATGLHLLDTRTGKDRLLDIAGAPAAANNFSPDGTLVVLESGSVVALGETESGRNLASVTKPSGFTGSGAAQFSPKGAAALGLRDGNGSRSTAILQPDGRSVTLDGASSPVRWAPAGDRLALSVEGGLRIVSESGALIRDIPLGSIESGYNLRWSPDGRYLAIANAYNVGGQRVFEAGTGREVLRTTGTVTCLGEYWLEDGTLEYGWEGERVSVPSGRILDGSSRSPRDEGFTYDQSAPAGATRLLLANGKAVEFRSTFWSVYYDEDGVRATTSNGAALFLIGIGGKGLCGEGQLPDRAVQLPPFAD